MHSREPIPQKKAIKITNIHTGMFIIKVKHNKVNIHNIGRGLIRDSGSAPWSETVIKSMKICGV